MTKTKIISGILFAGLTTGLLLFAQDRPSGDKERKGDRERKERDIKRDRERDEPRGDRERDKPRRESVREHGEGDRERREGERDKPRREGDHERERPRSGGDRERDERVHDQNGLQQWAQQQERRIHELREAGHNEEAEHLLENLKRTMAKHRVNTGRGHGPADERMRHMMAAIEHLRAVGMHDLAEQVEARAHGRHREREDHEDRDHERETHEHEHHDEGIGNLRQEVEELKRAIRDIQNHLEKRER